MNIRILAVGKLNERFWKDAVSEYSKRLSAFCNFVVDEIPDLKNPDLTSKALCKITIEKEGDEILKRLKGEKYIALCVEGREVGSEDLCPIIEDAAMHGGKLNFVIGGSLGLSENVKNGADMRISMSRMTFPHALARVIITEQIYRAYTIINNQNYHK